MNEIESLLERSERYLKSAEILLNDSDYESCVSRAYYAMFFSAEALLLTKELTFSSHKGVLTGLGEHFIKTSKLPKEMGKSLHRAFEKRQLGDYEFTFVISNDEAREILEDAKLFLATVKDYLSNWETN